MVNICSKNIKHFGTGNFPVCDLEHWTKTRSDGHFVYCNIIMNKQNNTNVLSNAIYY